MNTGSFITTVNSITDTITHVVQAIGGGLAVLALAFFAITLMFAGSNARKKEFAIAAITTALLGLVLLLAPHTVVDFLQQIFSGVVS